MNDKKNCRTWFRKSDLRTIERIIEDNLQFLLNAWYVEKSKHVNG